MDSVKIKLNKIYNGPNKCYLILELDGIDPLHLIPQKYLDIYPHVLKRNESDEILLFIKADEEPIILQQFDTIDSKQWDNVIYPALKEAIKNYKEVKEEWRRNQYEKLHNTNSLHELWELKKSIENKINNTTKDKQLLEEVLNKYEQIKEREQWSGVVNIELEL